MRTRTTQRRAGFSLIELLIVMAIIGILAAIIIPTYNGSVRKANEAAAVTTLNTIKVAQTKYQTDHKGNYGTFRQLFEGEYLDKRFNFDKPHIRGYIFYITLTPRTENRVPTFSVNADPEQAQGVNATGKMFFYTDSEHGISFSNTGPATTADELL